MIDDILVEDRLLNHNSDNKFTEYRLLIDRMYTEHEIDEDEPGYIPGDYAQQDETGYIGFLPPVG